MDNPCRWIHFLSIIVGFLSFFSCESSSSDDAVSRLKAYLRIDTSHPNPNYGPVTEFLVSQATELGLQVQKLEIVKEKPIVLITWAGLNTSLTSLLLNSHTDVVPAEELKWKYDPLLAFEDGKGNIYGRGAQDMKSVGVQYLEAIRVLKSSGYQPTRSVHLSYVPDEEIGGEEGMAKLVSSSEFQQLNVGICLDEGLACAEDYYRVFFGERSVWKLVIKAVGAPGHGSKLYDGCAMENLRESLTRIYEYRKSQFLMLQEGSKAEGEVVAINNVFLRAGTPIPSGFVMNLQPSEAEAGFDVRVPPLVDIADLETEIRTKWAPTSRNLTYTLTRLQPQPSDGLRLPTSADDMYPWWDLLQVAVQKVGGKLGAPMIRPSATDSRYIRNVNIPAFGFSPISNTPSLLHDHDEFLNAKEYLKGIKVYSEIIKAFSSHVDITDS
uniref:N-acyl-aliphatic-L-amino acid amidohydrolase n=1 Tax=Physcomitrium patens TaxID=3218 RepID=A0A2K1J0Z0_PHYPA|nr:aminoacylase-1-like [Physcomitrium patens]XP_024403202.1 aminoacylase-1-like [Physcomitrium patens]PNR35191.1 hypothetical protein PHYPA_023090 [Physcomitrium patens]|eukprot:XP_024403201.1 aminoacylase-1-like [Physcomitrella patens]